MASYEDQGTAYDPYAVGYERVGRKTAPMARSLHIGTATLTYTPDGAITAYDDGTSWGAQPHSTADYREIARRCGYGADTMAFCREHDAFHSLVADHFYGRPCPILWALAHGEPVDLARAPYIEVMVQTAQAWVRGGVRPIVGDVDWTGLKTRALALLDA